jgi:hypothetical protein
LAKGFYFGREPQAEAELQALLAAPLMGPLLWYSFYNYTVSGFELMAGLFNVVHALAETRTFRNFRREQGIGLGQCIYCTNTAGKFISEEHVVPEALGNDELVLEPGYVCDTCNHSLLERLDRALAGFGPIAFLKILNRKTVGAAPNDPAAKVQQFRGRARVSGEPFESNDVTWHVRDSEIFPYRRTVEYLADGRAEVRPLIDKLSFVTNTLYWALPLRKGSVEITAKDFETIQVAMKT